MIEPDRDSRSAMLSRCGCAAAVIVLVLAGLDWLGWLSGVESLTRGFSDWPQMTPWTALLMAVLAAAILLQSGCPSVVRVRIGCGLALVAGLFGLVFLLEYATGGSLGLSQLVLSGAVRDLPETFPGRRPSPQTGWSVLFLSIAISLTRLDRRWAHIVWSVCLAAAVAVPIIMGLAYLFDANALLTQAIAAAAGLLLLVVATVLARPDRSPVAWLLEHPEQRPLVRVVAVIALLPVVVGTVREVLLELGVAPGIERVLSLAVATAFVGVVVFLVGRRERALLAERAELREERREAEALYRLMADNAVDVIAYIRGTEVVWVSPSVQDAFGWPPQDWVGADFSPRIYPDDLPAVAEGIEQVLSGESAKIRVRMATAEGGYRWVEVRGKPAADTNGNGSAGVVVALRTIDEQVEAEQQLKRLARLDGLTGLLNHRECMDRLQATLANRRSPGSRLGLLFCDIDHFKAVNDTWGHLVGDFVLSELATRMRECLRDGDTVGRTGGDEMLVLLPGLNQLGEVRTVAEKIRCRAAEPIYHADTELCVTLSIGAAIAEPGESPTSVMTRADAAMYQAKEAGRNMIVSAEPASSDGNEYRDQ